MILSTLIKKRELDLKTKGRSERTTPSLCPTPRGGSELPRLPSNNAFPLIPYFVFMWGGTPSFLFRVMGKCKPYWYTKGAGSSINNIAIGSSSDSLFITYFVMHPVPLYNSISGHFKPYGSRTFGYRVKI